MSRSARRPMRLLLLCLPVLAAGCASGKTVARDGRVDAERPPEDPVPAERIECSRRSGPTEPAASSESARLYPSAAQVAADALECEPSPDWSRQMLVAVRYSAGCEHVGFGHVTAEETGLVVHLVRKAMCCGIAMQQVGELYLAVPRSFESASVRSTQRPATHDCRDVP